jgi:small subunit ribosomal protein S2
LAVVTMKNLLESGVHFGHQTKRWDPRMARYIFAERNGIHIIDLQKTIAAIKEAYDAVRQSVLAGKSVLFVGTKKQAQQSIEREAQRCNMHFVSARWLGGMLTNFATIKQSLTKLKKIEKMEVDGTFANMTKKEISRMQKEQARLERHLGGIKEMKDLPGVLFVVDINNESIAIAEARKMGIPIVAIVDTNCNPDLVDLAIPGNDDAIRAINLFTQIIANAVVEAENEVGLEVIETLQEEDGAEEYSYDQLYSNDIYDKDRFGGDQAEVVEKVALGEIAAVGSEGDDGDGDGDGEGEGDDSKTDHSFTDRDYSDYNPDEHAAKPKPAVEPEVPAGKAAIDEDTLYDGD